jgi:hypothetical protein
LALGGGAVLAGVWSAFLLPLLHATFSARTALLAPQRERWRSLLDRLREIRAAPIFRERVQEVEEEERALVRARTRESEVSREELALVKSRSREEKDEDKDKEKGTEGGDKEEEEEPPTVNMFADVAPLSAALRDLASSLDATATTRTSLVSTLEGYTSGLHRELFARGGATNSWGGTSSVGLSTLGANLAKAGGSADASPLGLPAAKSEEWDNVRREVRAIKGLLLNRRNFSVPARSVAA